MTTTESYKKNVIVVFMVILVAFLVQRHLSYFIAYLLSIGSFEGASIIDCLSLIVLMVFLILWKRNENNRHNYFRYTMYALVAFIVCFSEGFYVWNNNCSFRDGLSYKIIGTGVKIKKDGEAGVRCFNLLGFRTIPDCYDIIYFCRDKSSHSTKIVAVELFGDNGITFNVFDPTNGAQIDEFHGKFSDSTNSNEIESILTNNVGEVIDWTGGTKAIDMKATERKIELDKDVSF